MAFVGKIKKFFREVSSEMKKVSWPTKEQLKESTGVVLIVCAIFATSTFLIDEIVVSIVKFIF